MIPAAVERPPVVLVQVARAARARRPAPPRLAAVRLGALLEALGEGGEELNHTSVKSLEGDGNIEGSLLSLLTFF